MDVEQPLALSVVAMVARPTTLDVHSSASLPSMPKFQRTVPDA
jgi:hypothetical protein